MYGIGSQVTKEVLHHSWIIQGRDKKIRSIITDFLNFPYSFSGQYTVALPDCRTQIVDYYVDEYKQYHADVKYEGEICPDKTVHPHPAPYKAPHPAPYHAPAPAPYHAPAPAPYHPAPAPYAPY